MHANNRNAENHVRAFGYSLETLILFMEAALVEQIPPPPPMLPVTLAAMEAAVTSITTDDAAVAPVAFDPMTVYNELESDGQLPPGVDSLDLQTLHNHLLSRVVPAPHYATRWDKEKQPSWARPSPPPSQ